MELGLNLFWLLVASASFALVSLRRDPRPPAPRRSGPRILALVCALLILFPVISVTDDLHAEQAVLEDSNPSKRIEKFSGPARGISILDQSSLAFRIVAARCLPSPFLRVVGWMGVQDALPYPVTSITPLHPRPPPLSA